jgi:hypothetical protein
MSTIITIAVALAAMNVRKDQYRTYLEHFHDSLDSMARKLIPIEAGRLRHLSLLPARIIGHVSTQFGVAFEYLAAKETAIEIHSGSARVEELLLAPPRSLTRTRAAVLIKGPRAALIRFNCHDIFPFRLADAGASVSLTDCTFVTAGWGRSIGYAEIDGDRRIEKWTVRAATERAVEEVAAAQLEISRAKAMGVELG